MKKNNGITLIALVITIIVLLILAGVTINAIVGNESAMEKAKQARAENEKGNELDTIKLAVVDAVSLGDDGLVSLPHLKTALGKIPDVVEASDVIALTGEAPWEVKGQKASYLVSSNGTVTQVEGLSITGSLTIVEETVQEITVRKYGEAAGKEVSWSKEGNVTFVTDNTGATAVTGTPTGDTVYVKVGIKSSGTTGTIRVSAEGEESKSCNITIKEDKYLGEARQRDKYGYKVTGYDAKLTEVECWRLFYQDDDNTYLIANKPQGSYKPSDYYAASGETRYTTGASVSEVGRNLNEKYYKAYPTKFTLGETPENMRAVAWMTDTENELWSQYATGNASWAIASPTIELFVASFNAAGKVLTVSENGYSGGWTDGQGLSSSFRHGIYNYPSGDWWWIASPQTQYESAVYSVQYDYGWVTRDGNVTWKALAVRPIVCIPTITFNAAVDDGTYILIDE